MFAGACGVAPVVWDGPAAPPPRFSYVGAHGVPVAFGGGVCAATAAHTHGFPPVPKAAFVDTPEGVKDTRTLFPYFDPHPHLGRTCFREGWHLHLEKDPAMTWDADRGAYVPPAPTAP